MDRIQLCYRPLQLPVVVIASCLAISMCAGCGSGKAAAPAPTTAPSGTLAPTVVPTVTPVTNCADALTAPKAALSFPLPANTVTFRLPGAAGAGFYLECTLGATQASITTFLNAQLPAAGWHQWNPQVDDAGGCGTEANSYWLWVKGQQAVGWDFQAVTLPEWHLTFCDLAFATPTN
jgi:hypothetical protein